MSRFPEAPRIARNKDRDFIDEPPPAREPSAPGLPTVLARLAGEPEADRHGDPALDRCAAPPRRDETPAVAHRRQGRLVERGEAGGADHAHVRRAPVGRDQDLEEDDALLPEPARHQRVRRGGGARARAGPPPRPPPPPPRRPTPPGSGRGGGGGGARPPLSATPSTPAW